MLELVRWSPLHLLIPLVIIQRLLELRLAKRNTAWLISKGAREHDADHYPMIVTLHVLWIVGMTGEIIVLSRQVSDLWPLWLGLFVAAQLLRYWAIRTLGRRWTTRIIVPPRSTPITRGPYRHLRHPNYAAVIVELAALPLMYDAIVTAATVSILNALVLRRRIRAEETALGFEVNR